MSSECVTTKIERVCSNCAWCEVRTAYVSLELVYCGYDFGCYDARSNPALTCPQFNPRYLR